MALALVELNKINDLKPAAMHELDAARYLGLSRPTFRGLLMAGIIPFVIHANGKQRIFLREDLDAYLHGLTKRTMAPRENSSLVALKGAAKSER
jgi:excisionase family DNA binding protein